MTRFARELTGRFQKKSEMVGRVRQKRCEPLVQVIAKYLAMLRTEELPRFEIVRAFKKELLDTALSLAKGNKTEAARLLKMNRSSFALMYRRISDPLFKVSFDTGRFQITISSSEKIPEYLPDFLIKEMKKSSWFS